jgi:exosortase
MGSLLSHSQIMPTAPVKAESATAEVSGDGLLLDSGVLPYLIPAALVVGWWLYDLSFQWASLVEYRFGWIVVMLTAYLAWERWPNRPKHGTASSVWLCAAIAVSAFPIVLISELYKNAIARVPATSFCLSIGCWMFLSANLLLVCGWRTLKHFLFPLLFFFVAVPLPKSIWNPVVLGLQHFVTGVDVELLKLGGVAASQQATVIKLPNTMVGVDEACSGVRSLQSSIMAALFVGDLTLRRVTWKVIFFIAGILLAIAGNITRSMYLALTAYWDGPDALNRVHDAAGWSVLIFTAVGLIVLSLMVTKLEEFSARRVAELNARAHELNAKNPPA